MKYIDADKLRKKIENERKFIDGLFIEGDNTFYDGQDDAYHHILALIDSLQQEQEPTCKTCGFYENNCPFIRGKLIPYPNKVCKDYTYSEVKAQEQPEVDLEKEVLEQLDWFNAKYKEPACNYDDMNTIAHHFYELGLNARKED